MPATLKNFLSGYSPPVRAVCLAARRLVLDVIPGVVEQVDPPSKIIAYGYDRTYAGLICAIAPHRAHVNLMFSMGTLLPDPAGLLEGTGKKARHIKLQEPSDVDNPAVRALLKAAVKAMQTK